MAGEERAAKVAAAMSTGAAIMAALAWLAGKKAQAAPPGYELPDEFWNLLIAIAGSTDSIDTDLDTLIDQIKKLSLDVQGWPPHARTIQSVRVVCVAAATPYHLPDFAIPDGMSLCIKSWPFNGNLIYIGEDQGAATNINRIHALAASEQVFYYIENANAIWISAVAAGDSVTITSEKREEL